MPIRRTRRSRSEQVEHQAAAEKLESWGLIQKKPELPESSVLDVHVNRMGSQVIERPTGMPYYLISVELVARQAGLILDYCRITINWDDQIVLASDELKSRRISGLPFYPPEQLLNERIENGLRFRHRGDMVRGMIVASGLRPIPGVYRDNSIVPFKLAFTDSLGNELSTQAALQVSRRRESGKKMQRPKEDLFGRLLDETIGETEQPAGDESVAEGTSSSETPKRND